jgi:hypothetical protein
MIIRNEADLMMVVEELMDDGFDMSQCLDALEDGNFLGNLAWDSDLDEDQKEDIVTNVYSDLEKVA